MSVANLTRQDGLDFLKIVPQAGDPNPDDGIPPERRERRSCKTTDKTALGSGSTPTITLLQNMNTSIAPNSDMQEKVFAFLADPATHGNTPVRRIDTHAASVFLAGHRALKIKRAVRFPFLDYSTLAKRKSACEEEMKINRSFAPQVYRRVVPITRRDDGTLSIDGDGTPVEWAVEMARFDERLTIDHIAEAGPPHPDLALKIADVIAASHAIAPRAATDPWISSIPSIIARNTKAFRSAGSFAADDIDALDDASQSAFSRIRRLLEQRGQQGLVRRCHGDLHLANIVLIERKPVLFDAIEFDPTIASVDVLYDLAFVIMDFLHYERYAAANIILNRYLAATSEDNLDALASLPLFMSMRAAIRANVLLARLGQDGGDKDTTQRTARAYFANTEIHSLLPQRPFGTLRYLSYFATKQH